jgi:hypothetical protein
MLDLVDSFLPKTLLILADIELDVTVFVLFINALKHVVEMEFVKTMLGNANVSKLLLM